MANDINEPKEFSWAGLAATTGAAGLGGFIFDRYIRKNRNLGQNLAMAAGFGAGGALLSTAYQIASERARIKEIEKNSATALENSSDTFEATNTAGNKVKVNAATKEVVEPPKKPSLAIRAGNKVEALENGLNDMSWYYRYGPDALGGSMYLSSAGEKAVETLKAYRKAKEAAEDIILKAHTPELATAGNKLPKAVADPLLKAKKIVTVRGSVAEQQAAQKLVNDLSAKVNNLQGPGKNWFSNLFRAQRLKRAQDALANARQRLTSLITERHAAAPLTQTEELAAGGISKKLAQKALNIGDAVIHRNGKAIINPRIKQPLAWRTVKGTGRTLKPLAEGAKTRGGAWGLGLAIANELIHAASRNHLLSRGLKKAGE